MKAPSDRPTTVPFASTTYPKELASPASVRALRALGARLGPRGLLQPFLHFFDLPSSKRTSPLDFFTHAVYFLAAAASAVAVTP